MENRVPCCKQTTHEWLKFFPSKYDNEMHKFISYQLNYIIFMLPKRDLINVPFVLLQKINHYGNVINCEFIYYVFLLNYYITEYNL